MIPNFGKSVIYETSSINIFYLFFLSAVVGQDKEKISPEPDKNKKILIVDAGCGQCKLGLAGSTCDLAVRIDGKSYFVDGTAIDSHGDAHAEDGFCNAIKKARVQGEIVNNRFKATYFKLIPVTETNTKQH